MGWPLAASTGSIDTGPPHPRGRSAGPTRNGRGPTVLILRAAGAPPGSLRPRRRPRNGTSRGGRAGRGFSTTLSPDLSTPRRGPWTVAPDSPEAVDAHGSGAGILAQGKAQPRAIGQPPALVGLQLQAGGRVVAQEEVPVEVDPFRQRRDRCRGRDPDGRLLHAAEEGPEP